MENENEEGFVLLPALWLSGLLAVALSAFLVHVKIHVKTAANLIENAKSELVADGIVQFVAYELASGRDRKQLAGGIVSRCQVDDEYVAFIRVQDQGGLVDLNATSPATLRSLLTLLGLAPEKAEGLAEKIADFRDVDDAVRPSGAEAEDYRAAGLPLPKNAPFLDKAELDQVLGMSDDVRRQMAPLITIHSQQAGIDPITSPKVLREAQSGGLPMGHSQQQVFGIEAVVKSTSGSVFNRHAVVRIVQQARKLFVIKEWSRGGTEEAANMLSQPAGPCLFAVRFPGGQITP
jgi:general secretion pathway protein K